MVSRQPGAKSGAADSPVESPLGRLQALLILLPAALLAWPGPGAPLSGVPTSAASGAGLCLLASIPAALLLLVRRVELRMPGLVLLLVPLCLAAPQTRSVLDSYGADRALCVLATALIQALCAASLGASGRRTLVAGLIGLSLLWIVRGLNPLDDYTGTLGNTGDLAEAALPGALCGLALFARSRSRAGLAAGLAFALYVGWVPVYAGAVAVTAALLLALARRMEGARTVTLVAGLTLLAALGARHFMAPGDATVDVEPTTDTLAPQAGSSIGGFAFRKYTWARVPALLREHPWTGVGPGQFEAEFPLYRDPQEIELSSFGRQAPFETQVEHAHNDWLEGLAEYGVIGGGAWIAFLGLVALLAWRRLTDAEAARAALAVAALGVLVGALFNSPLLEGPAAHAVDFAVFGTVLGGGGLPHARRSLRGVLLPLASIVLLALLAPRAFGLFRHGRALAALSGDAIVAIDGVDVHAARRKLAAIEGALAARPDSVVALSERAFLRRSLGEDEASQLRAWQDVLERQPHRFEALLATGNLHARAERFDEADAWYECARAVDAQHPGLRRNALTLALARGRPDAVARALSELGEIDVETLQRMGARELLRGRPHLGLVLLERVDDNYLVRSGEQALALSQRLADDGLPLLSDAMAAWAHMAWAHEHMEANRPDVAVRSYRQSLRIARGYEESVGDAAAIRLELAAALVASGRKIDALAELEGVEPTPVQLAELPPWAEELLSDAGLIEQSSGG